MSPDSDDSAPLARQVGFVTFVGGLGGGLVFPILPALGLQLGISSFLVGLILSANRITRLIFDAPAGRLVDRIGGMQVLTAGLCLESFGIMFYSGGLHLGHVAAWFLAGRILFGIGSALLIVGAQTVVLGLSSHANRGRRTATVRIALGMGMPGGLVLGGVIADVASDDAAFWVAAAVTLTTALIAWRRARSWPPKARPETPAGESRAGLSALKRLRAVARLPEFPVLAAAWLFNAMIFLCVQGALLATLVVLIHRRELHLFGFADQGTAGLVMAIMLACASATALALGRGIDRLPFRSVLVLPSLVMLATGFVVLAYAGSLASIVLGVLLIGGSFNGVTLPMLALLGDVTPPAQYGRAIGIYQLFGDIGGSLGPIIGLEAGTRFGLMPTYLGLAALIGVGCLGALWVSRSERRTTGNDA